LGDARGEYDVMTSIDVADEIIDVKTESTQHEVKSVVSFQTNFFVSHSHLIHYLLKSRVRELQLVFIPSATVPFPFQLPVPDF
jgi:hypothetical protein